MEHIVQFAISIDDEAIKRAVVETATKQVADELRENITKTLVSKSPWGRGSVDLTDDGERIVKEVVAQYKDEILAGAIKAVSETITRNKKYKEFLAKLAEEVIE